MSTKAQQIRVEDETPDAELPEGWATAPVIDCCDLLRGVSYAHGEASPMPSKGRIALLRANNITDQLTFEDLQYVPEHRVSDGQLLRVGDVVVAMSSGSKTVVGKTAVLDRPWQGTFGAFCGVLRPSTYLDWRYFGLFFRTRNYRDTISDLSAGVNINNLKREYFSQIHLPIAPANEQARIATQIVELLDQVGSTRKRLVRVSALLKSFRQSVLAAACSGKLTEEWRKDGGGTPQENGNALLERIYAAKAALGDSKSKRFPMTPVGSDEEIWELPMTWCYARLGEITQQVADIDHKMPKAVEKGVKFISAKDLIDDGTLNLTQDVKRISEADYQRLSRKANPQRDDIIYSRIGARLGKDQIS